MKTLGLLFITLSMNSAVLAADRSVPAENCWVDSAEHFNLPPMLLYAIASVESSHNPQAVAHANNGTRSIGLMQINSSWFPKLAQYGITEGSLYTPCVNIRVGAWILAQEVSRYGYTWEAIGAYYAGPYDAKTKKWKLRHYREYSGKVIARWRSALDGKLPGQLVASR